MPAQIATIRVILSISRRRRSFGSQACLPVDKVPAPVPVPVPVPVGAYLPTSNPRAGEQRARQRGGQRPHVCRDAAIHRHSHCLTASRHCCTTGGHCRRRIRSSCRGHSHCSGEARDCYHGRRSAAIIGRCRHFWRSSGSGGDQCRRTTRGDQRRRTTRGDQRRCTSSSRRHSRRCLCSDSARGEPRNRLELASRSGGQRGHCASYLRRSCLAGGGE